MGVRALIRYPTQTDDAWVDRPTPLRRVLATIAAVPIICLLAVVGWSVAAANDQLEQAATLSAEVDHLENVATLRSFLAAEASASFGVIELRSFGLTQAQLLELLGFELQREVGPARADTDAMLRRISSPSLTEGFAPLIAQREAVDAGTATARSYQDATAIAVESIVPVRNRAVVRVSGLRASLDDGEVGRSIETLIGALDYVDVAASELTAVVDLGARRSGDQDAVAALTARSFLVDRTVDRLEILLDGNARFAWDRHLNSWPRTRLRELSTRMAKPGPFALQKFDVSGAKELASIIDELVRDFNVIVHAAADDSRESVALLRAERLRTITMTAAVLAALVLSTLITLSRSSRAILAPLASLAASARAVSAGDLGSDRIVVAGPAELRDVVTAFNDVTANLRGVRDRLERAAAGEVATDGSHLPGDLGAVLGRSMSRLTNTVTELRDVRDQLSHEASHDSLTGLANRASAMRWLETARSHNDVGLALCFIDLDGFKRINDEYGHDIGDQVLSAAAHRLRATVRSDDLAARFGGDEFVVGLRFADGERDVPIQLAQRLVEVLAEPITTAAGEHQISGSIGMCLVDRDAAIETPGELLALADAACYEAKTQGRGRFVIAGSAKREEQAAIH